MLARAAVKLKDINLRQSYLSCEQVETMFTVLDKEKNIELHTLGLEQVKVVEGEPQGFGFSPL